MNLVGLTCRSAWTRVSAFLTGSWAVSRSERSKGLPMNLETFNIQHSTPNTEGMNNFDVGS